jgi:diacylglycerol kinase (ATP)
MKRNNSIKRFSWKARLQSFQYAFAGIKQFFHEEHNAWIHLAATFLVIILSILLRPTGWEIISLVLVTGLVWVAEFFNTAIENLSDMVSEEDHPRIGFIKDVAAAAVLVMALVALITGCIIFIPKIL